MESYLTFNDLESCSQLLRAESYYLPACDPCTASAVYTWLRLSEQRRLPRAKIMSLDIIPGSRLGTCVRGGERGDSDTHLKLLDGPVQDGYWQSQLVDRLGIHLVLKPRNAWMGPTAQGTRTRKSTAQAKTKGRKESEWNTRQHISYNNNWPSSPSLPYPEALHDGH